MRQHRDESGCHIIQQEALAAELDSQFFSVDYWRGQSGVESLEDGRGGTLKLTFDDTDIVLRQYRRGGMVRFFSADRYIWSGLKRSRPWREFSILQQAITFGLPVPEPLAACVCQKGLTYRGSIMTRLLAGTRSLSTVLVERELEAEVWYQLGTVIRQFHHRLIRHADLNAINILIDEEGKIFLVDFDKASLMRGPGDWQWKPLYRLQQSLQKWQKSRRLIYREENWQSLMDGYQA